MILMVMGRPRQYDREEVAEKLIEWAQLEDSTNLNGFTAWYPGFIIPDYICRWAKEDENFRCAYEYAKSLIGERREKKLRDGELHVKAYDLNATVYDRYLKEERREEKEFEAELKKASEENAKADELASSINKLADSLQEKKEEE